jgi:hypothetical protein
MADLCMTEIAAYCCGDADSPESRFDYRLVPAFLIRASCCKELLDRPSTMSAATKPTPMQVGRPFAGFNIKSTRVIVPIPL